MTLPAGYLGTLLVFWGWRVQLLWLAVPMAALMEGARFLPVKWELKPPEFNRFVDITTVFLAAGFVISLTTAPERALSLIMKWLPVIFLPMAGAQAFSTAGKFPVRSLFLAARRQINRPVYGTRRVDVLPLYAVVSLCGAGVGNPADPVFFPACFLFSVWALWPVRPKRYPVLLWMLVILASGILGYAGHKGFYTVRTRLHHLLVDFYGELMGINPFKTTTAIGEIGDLKLSGKILFRVRLDPETGRDMVYLHGATYDRFKYDTWFSSHAFTPIPSDDTRTQWQIGPPGPADRTMTFYFYPKKKDLLFLPAGTFRLEETKAGTVEKNGVGSIRVTDCPALLRGAARFNPGTVGDVPPGPRDLLVPKKENRVARSIVESLGLGSLTPESAVRHLEDWFLQQFTYSLELAGRGRSDTPLAHFLTRTRKGHCELFATATVLILRSAGIPARYATGFVAHEYSPLNRMTLVRQRDAHAWVKAFVNNRWIRVDTTPPGFIAADRDAMEPALIRDLFSLLGFTLSRLRHEIGPKLLDSYGLWLILPLALILVYRLRFNQKVRQRSAGTRSRRSPKGAADPDGLEGVARKLGTLGFLRQDHETWMVWFHRIREGIAPLGIDTDLPALIRLENKLRFSRDGLTPDEALTYRARADDLMARLSRKAGPPGGDGEG